MNDRAVSERSDFDRFVRILRRRGWVVVVCVLLAAGGAVAYSTSQEKIYEAKASLLFRDPALDQKVFGFDRRRALGRPVARRGHQRGAGLARHRVCPHRT